jgi:hypothetical protein
MALRVSSVWRQIAGAGIAMAFAFSPMKALDLRIVRKDGSQSTLSNPKFYVGRYDSTTFPNMNVPSGLYLENRGLPIRNFRDPKLSSYVKEVSFFFGSDGSSDPAESIGFIPWEKTFQVIVKPQKVQVRTPGTNFRGVEWEYTVRILFADGNDLEAPLWVMGPVGESGGVVLGDSAAPCTTIRGHDTLFKNVSKCSISIDEIDLMLATHLAHDLTASRCEAITVGFAGVVLAPNNLKDLRESVGTFRSYLDMFDCTPDLTSRKCEEAASKLERTLYGGRATVDVLAERPGVGRKFLDSIGCPHTEFRTVPRLQKRP